MEFDKDLIEQSIAKQYHVLPSEQKELSYADWTKLVSGLMDDTPLGRVVQIRTEKDQKVISKFSQTQKAIRAEWNMFLSQKAKKEAAKPENKEKERQRLLNLEKMLANMFGGR